MSATGVESLPLSRRGPARDGSLSTALSNILFGPVSALFLIWMMWRVLRGSAPAFDFRHAYWTAGHRVLIGHSPYAWTASQFRHYLAFVYPALSAVAFTPMALFSRAFGSYLFTFASVGLVPLTLWLMRVRDWRVYGVALLWLPVCDGWMTANESLFLACGLACLWRWRDRPWASGLAVAVMISLKPLMWPLALWLIATRRWRASAHALAYGVVLNVAAWSVVGFGQIGPYLHAAAVDTADSWRTGFGVPALLGHFGAGRTTGIVAMLALSAVLVGAVLYSGIIQRDQVRALILAIALMLVSSPLVWSHYIVLLLVPLALLRPRLGWVWLLPILMWVCPPASPVYAWQAIVYWVVGAVMFVALLRQTRTDPAPHVHFTSPMLRLEPA